MSLELCVRVLGLSMIHSLWIGGVWLLLAAAARIVWGGVDPVKRHRTSCGAAIGHVIVMISVPTYLVGVSAGTGGDPALAGSFHGTVTDSLAPLAAYLGTAWLIVSTLGIVVCVLRFRAVGRCVRDAYSPNPGSELAGRFANLRTKMRAPTQTQLLLSMSFGGMAAVGVFRPRVIVGTYHIKRLSATDLELALAHELAHILQRDTWFPPIHLISKVMFWVHPGTWIIDSWIRLDTEIRCDALVVERLSSARPYARFLARFTESIEAAPALAVGAEAAVTRRLRWLLDKPLERGRTQRCMVAVATLLLLSVFALLVSHGRWI